MTSVVYFDQRLGAAHSKRWSKLTNLLQNLTKNQGLLVRTKTLVECFIPRLTLDQRFVAIFKNPFFAKFCHPNAGRNIQQTRRSGEIKENVQLRVEDVGVLLTKLILHV